MWWHQAMRAAASMVAMAGLAGPVSLAVAAIQAAKILAGWFAIAVRDRLPVAVAHRRAVVMAGRVAFRGAAAMPAQVAIRAWVAHLAARRARATVAMRSRAPMARMVAQVWLV